MRKPANVAGQRAYRLQQPRGPTASSSSYLRDAPCEPGPETRDGDPERTQVPLAGTGTIRGQRSTVPGAVTVARCGMAFHFSEGCRRLLVAPMEATPRPKPTHTDVQTDPHTRTHTRRRTEAHTDPYRHAQTNSEFPMKDS